MKLKTVERAKDIVLEGLKSEVDFVNGAIKVIRLEDTKGNLLVFHVGDYNVKVSVKAPPEMKKVWKLSGLITDLKVDENFKHRLEAEERKLKIESSLQDENNTLKIDEVEIEEEE